MEPGAFQLGRISALDEGVVLRKVSPVGTWIEEEFPYDAITRIGFGGGYADGAGASPSAPPSG